MLPLLPLVFGTAFVGGAVGLGWYWSLSEEKRLEVDRLTNNFAWDLYRKAVANLTQAEADRVAGLVSKHLGV